MTVRHDRSYLRATDGEFISRGYAEDGISSVNIRFEYSEEQKHKNVRSAKLMTPAQWTACCVVEPQKRSAYIFPVMDAIAKSFVCYQYDKENGPKYDSSDWELFFWCGDFSMSHCGGLNGRDYSYIRLSFNERHEASRHEEICKRLLLFVTEPFSEVDNLSVVVQHKTRFFDEKINREAAELSKGLEGMKCRYMGMEGRPCCTENGLIFMKKRARSNGYVISPREILRMSWEMEAA